jgi:hypothetical protein
MDSKPQNTPFNSSLKGAEMALRSMTLIGCAKTSQIHLLLLNLNMAVYLVGLTLLSGGPNKDGFGKLMIKLGYSL